MNKYNPVAIYYKGTKITYIDRVFIAKGDSVGHYPPDYPDEENYWWKLDGLEENDKAEDMSEEVKETEEVKNMNRSRKTAEEIFSSNIGKEIVAQLICVQNDTRIFTGVLVGIYCNTFIVRTHNGAIEMFRYEDIRYLYCKTLADMASDVEQNKSYKPRKGAFHEIDFNGEG